MALTNLKAMWLQLQQDNQLPNELLPWLTARDLKSFTIHLDKLDRKSLISEVPPPVPSQHLVRLASTFHTRAQTHTPKVAAGLDAMGKSDLVIRCAHQPNIFPAVNVLAQPLVASRLGQHISRQQPDSVAECFFLLDYDISSDNRFRVAHFPTALMKDGFAPIRLPLNKALGNLPMFLLPQFESGWLDSSFAKIRSLLHQEYHSKAALSEYLIYNLEQCQRIAEKTLDISETLVDFTSNYMSHIINQLWQLPTLFIPGHLAISLAEPHFEFLWDASHTIFEAKLASAAILSSHGIVIRASLIGNALQLNFWILCDCGERLAVFGADVALVDIHAQCSKCGRKYQYNRRRMRPFRELVKAGRITPRIVADNLFDTIAWGNYAGVSYLGSIEHYLFSAIVSLQLGIRPLPEYLSRVTYPLSSDEEPRRGLLEDKYSFAKVSEESSRKALTHVLNGSASCLYYFVQEPPMVVASRIVKWLIQQETGS